MTLVPDWRKAWRWFSVQAFAFLAVIPVVWMNLPPDVKAMVPDSWNQWIFLVISLAAVLGGVGRVIDQNKAPPA